MVENAYKLSKDKQSQKKKIVVYGICKEYLHKELLANTRGKYQRISEGCKFNNPKEPGCTCLRHIRPLNWLETLPAPPKLGSQPTLKFGWLCFSKCCKEAIKIGPSGAQLLVWTLPLVQNEGFFIKTGKLLWTWSYILKTDFCPSLSRSGDI